MSQIPQETADWVAFSGKIYIENFCALSILKTKNTLLEFGDNWIKY